MSNILLLTLFLKSIVVDNIRLHCSFFVCFYILFWNSALSLRISDTVLATWTSNASWTLVLLKLSSSSCLSIRLSVCQLTKLLMNSLTCLSGIKCCFWGPVAMLHWKALGWLEGTFFQCHHAASNILFVIGSEADLSRLLFHWHSDSLWLAAGENDAYRRWCG